MKYMFVIFLALPLLGQEVTLPIDAFHQLRQEAEPLEDPEKEEKIPIAIERVRADVEINEHRAMITQTMTIHVWGNDWQQLSMPENGSFIDADFGEVEARLEGEELHIRGKGRHEIKIVSVVKVDRDERAARPTWKFDWSVVNAPLLATIKTKESMQEVHVLDQAILETTGANQWHLVAQPNATLSFTIYETTYKKISEELVRFSSITAAKVFVKRNHTETKNFLDIKVNRGMVEKLIIPIPENQEVTSVTGKQTVNWQVDGDVLLIEPLTPLTNEMSLLISLTGETQAQLRPAIMVPENSERPRLFCSINIGNDGIAELVERGSSRNFQGRGQLPNGFYNTDVITYVIDQPEKPPVWKLFWAERTQVLAAQIDRLFVDVLMGSHEQANYQIWVEVRNAGLSNLEIELPEHFEVLFTQRNGIRTTPGGEDQKLIIPLNAAQNRQIVVIQGLLPVKVPSRGAFDIQLPSFHAPVTRVEVKMRTPKDWNVALADPHRKGKISLWQKASDDSRPAKLTQMILGNSWQSAQELSIERLPMPTSYTFIPASWSALTNNPGKISYKINQKSQKARWL